MFDDVFTENSPQQNIFFHPMFVVNLFEVEWTNIVLDVILLFSYQWLFLIVGITMTSESASIAINPGNHQNTSKCTNTQVYKVQILGLDISHLEQRWQFIICSLGVFYFYILYGYFQV